MNDKEKKTIYWHLKETLDKLDAGCNDCDDIDCDGNYLFKMLKKRHQCNVIDKKSCRKQMKIRADELRKIVYSPFFKEQRMDPCHHCKKMFERDDMKFGAVARSYTGSVEVDHFCKDCMKKYKNKVI